MVFLKKERQGKGWVRNDDEKEDEKSWKISKTKGTAWSRTRKNPDVNTGPLAHLFALSPAPLTHLLTPHCLLECLWELNDKRWDTRLFCTKVGWRKAGRTSRVLTFDSFQNKKGVC